MKDIIYSQHKMTEQKQEQRAAEERIVRVAAKDIEGKMTIYSGLTKVKGVSWALSNAVCKKLKIPRTKKIGDLTEKEVQEIEKFLKNPDIPSYLVNRRKDMETGDDKHLTGVELEFTKEFDIKRLRKIKSYRGTRHAAGLPVRGQRTKAHFRKNRAKSAGIKKK